VEEISQVTEEDRLKAEVEKAETKGTAAWAVTKIVTLVFEFLAFVFIVLLIAHGCHCIDLQPLVNNLGK
jgi:hypothetical protein